MLRYLTALGLGWFLYTETGRKTAMNIGRNSLPLIEKELGIKIVEPLRELTKEPERKEKKKND
jgi:hypothetical protein